MTLRCKCYLLVVVARSSRRLRTFLSFLRADTHHTPRAVLRRFSSQDAVWGIVFELHRIAPSLLTTVIGNVAAALQVEESDRRLRVVKLLGRLFYAQTSDVGVKFSSCFRQWCQRVNDVDVTIRKQMARCLVKILENKPDLRESATSSLITMLADPVTDIRLEVVHNICDLANEDPTKIVDELLLAVGQRVSSKSKTERKVSFVSHQLLLFALAVAFVCSRFIAASSPLTPARPFLPSLLILSLFAALTQTGRCHGPRSDLPNSLQQA